MGRQVGSLILNGRSPWSVRGRKSDTLEEKAAAKNSQKQSKEDVGETWGTVFPFQIQVLGAVNRSLSRRRIPATQKQRHSEYDMARARCHRMESQSKGVSRGPRLVIVLP